METASQDQGPYSIVVAIDFCPPCEAAVREALRVAAARTGCDVHVVHVIGSTEGGATRSVRIKSQEVALEELPARMREYVSAQAGGLTTPGAANLGIHVRIGEPVDAIIQMTVDVQADLLIVGTHSREGLKRMVLGSVAEQLVHNAHCPVLVARPTSYEGLQTSERIDPPCPDCLAARRRSAGTQWWCDRHRTERRRTTHVYSGMAEVHWTAGSADVYGPGTSATEL